MGKQSPCLWSFFRVGVETVLHKRIELPTPPLRILETLNRLIFQLPHRNKRLEVGVGNYPFCQFDGSNAQRPYISFVGVLTVLHNFGTHPIRRANLRLMTCIGVHALGGDPKVSQFGNSFFIEQNISSFNVPVDLLVGVQVDESIENRLQDGGNLILGKFFLGNVEQIDDAAGVAVLEYNPEVVVLEVGAVVLDNVVIVTKFEDLDLLFNRS